METSKNVFSKVYEVTIDTVPLPEGPQDRIKAVLEIISPTLTQIISDAATVMIGTWPTPEEPITK